MATERRRAVRLLPVLPLGLFLAMPATAHAAQPWWEPVAFGGQRVTSVEVDTGALVVATPTGAYMSLDGGRSFQPSVSKGTPPTATDQPKTLWEIRAGTVVTGPSDQSLAPDALAPFLGVAAHLIAAPAAIPGVVVAVGTDNHVWRRARSGQWATSFIVLPAGGLSGTPAVTSLAAFTQPLSGAVYMGTDGYGVLISQDGGNDWIRADPGLPEKVLALATDSNARALFAATDQGLFVHHLQALPAPPVYHDASLYLRWLGIALVSLAATAAALVGLRRALR